MSKNSTTQTNNPTTHQLLIIGDSLKVLKNNKLIPSESINLIVTSPPYGLGKDYGEVYDDDFDIDAWVKMIEKLSKLCHNILAPNGSFFLNISPIPHKKTKEIMPLDSFAYFAGKKAGFYLRNKIIWNFNNMQNCVRRLSGRWESILWFVKDIDNYVFNLEEIRLPYITKKDKRLTGTGRNPTDVWYFDRVNNMTKNKFNLNHPCVYPEPMIERIIKMSSSVGDKILDPFVGSGTTMRVAKLLGRNSIGIEINPIYEELIERRLEPENSTLLGNCKFEVIKF